MHLKSLTSDTRFLLVHLMLDSPHPKNKTLTEHRDQRRLKGMGCRVSGVQEEQGVSANPALDSGRESEPGSNAECFPGIKFSRGDDPRQGGKEDIISRPDRGETCFSRVSPGTE